MHIHFRHTAIRLYYPYAYIYAFTFSKACNHITAPPYSVIVTYATRHVKGGMCQHDQQSLLRIPLSRPSEISEFFIFKCYPSANNQD